jgi:hypothetical protein
MTFPKNKNTINVDKLSEVINDNEMGLQFNETSDLVISVKKETPEQITKIFSYVGDEWDNIHGDMVYF